MTTPLFTFDAGRDLIEVRLGRFEFLAMRGIVRVPARDCSKSPGEVIFDVLNWTVYLSDHVRTQAHYLKWRAAKKAREEA